VGILSALSHTFNVLWRRSMSLRPFNLFSLCLLSLVSFLPSRVLSLCAMGGESVVRTFRFRYT